MTDRTDGMTVLYGRFDPITGALIETAFGLSQKMNELWREEDPRARCSPGQLLMADALAGLVTREDTGDGQGTNLPADRGCC